MHSMSRLIAASLVGALTMACAAGAPASTEAEDARLNAFVDAVFERVVAESPEFQSALGRQTDRLGEWDDRSDAFADAQIEKIGRAHV